MPSTLPRPDGASSSALTHPVLDERRVRKTVLLACVGVFVAYLPITGISVSLASMAGALGASTADLQWVVDFYTLPMAALILSAGVAGNSFGHKRVFLAGLGLLGAGATLSLVAPTVQVLWVGQVIMGSGAAGVLPATLALIAHAATPSARGRQIGWWASAIVLGLTVGPFVSGLILSQVGWRWIFLPYLPIVAAAAFVGERLLPKEDSATSRELDWAGQLSAMVAILGLVLGVIEGGSHGFTAPVAVVGYVLACAGFLLFLRAESRSAAPLLPLNLFRSRSFTGAGSAALLAMFGLIGSNFVLSLYFGEQEHLSPIAIACRFAALNGTNALVSPFVGRLAGRVKSRTLLVSGLMLAGGGFATLTGLAANASFGQVAWRLAAVGAGFALILGPVSAAAVNAVPLVQAAIAGAANNSLRQIGSSLGPAVLGAVLTARLASGGFIAALHTTMLISAAALFLGAALTAWLLASPHDMRRP